MDTLIKVKDTPEGKHLLAYLKSLNSVDILGNSDEFISVLSIKESIMEAEKSKSIPLDEAKRIAETWESKYGK